MDGEEKSTPERCRGVVRSPLSTVTGLFDEDGPSDYRPVERKDSFGAATDADVDIRRRLIDIVIHPPESSPSKARTTRDDEPSWSAPVDDGSDDDDDGDQWRRNTDDTHDEEDNYDRDLSAVDDLGQDDGQEDERHADLDDQVDGDDGDVEDDRVNEEEDEDEEKEEEEVEEEGDEEEEEDELPYPGFIPITMGVFTQTSRPRSWCLRLITNPYPFQTKSNVGLAGSCLLAT